MMPKFKMTLGEFKNIKKPLVAKVLGRQKHPWVLPLGPPQGMVKEPKTIKSLSLAFNFKCFHNYKLLFFHVYQFQALIYNLKFI
jgi:hypothetical protein